jgi:hypothetical protein
LSFRNKGPKGYCVKTNKRSADDPTGAFRTIAVTTNGALLDSFTFTSPEATDDTMEVHFEPGVTNVHVTVELNLRDGSMSILFAGGIEPNDGSEGRKGWDGLIYGPDRPVKKPPARMVVIPPVSPAEPPITELRLVCSGWSEFVIEEPTITESGRKWGDGHVTLMKAYDDGEQGVEFVAGSGGGGVSVDLGFASNFEFRVSHMQGSDVPNQEQLFGMVGWPPGTTINRPPPYTNWLRLAQSGSGFGVDCFADFTGWGVTNVTLQLRNGGALVKEAMHVPASAAAPVATLSGFPGILGCPGVGVLKLADTNGFMVLSGLDCGGLPCVGDELLIQTDGWTDPTNPIVAFARLDIVVSEDMDQRIHGFQVTPAATPVPIQSDRVPSGIQLNWEGDGFRLQGAETVHGSWFDLGPGSGATIPTIATSRVFRLMSD